MPKSTRQKVPQGGQLELESHGMERQMRFKTHHHQRIISVTSMENLWNCPYYTTTIHKKGK
jgi:hypothetical protein